MRSPTPNAMGAHPSRGNSVRSGPIRQKVFDPVRAKEKREGEMWERWLKACGYNPVERWLKACGYNPIDPSNSGKPVWYLSGKRVDF